MSSYLIAGAPDHHPTQISTDLPSFRAPKDISSGEAGEHGSFSVDDDLYEWMRRLYSCEEVHEMSIDTYALVLSMPLYPSIFAVRTGHVDRCVRTAPDKLKRI